MPFWLFFCHVTPDSPRVLYELFSSHLLLFLGWFWTLLLTTKCGSNNQRSQTFQTNWMIGRSKKMPCFVPLICWKNSYTPVCLYICSCHRAWGTRGFEKLKKKKPSHEVEYWLVKYSIFLNSQFFVAKVIIFLHLIWQSLSQPWFLELPDFSNQFLFPLEVWKIGILLYIIEWSISGNWAQFSSC